MDFDAIVLPYITFHPLVNKAPADILVMPLLRDGPSCTSPVDERGNNRLFPDMGVGLASGGDL
jgi:hypothetical protein